MRVKCIGCSLYIDKITDVFIFSYIGLFTNLIMYCAWSISYRTILPIYLSSFIHFAFRILIGNRVTLRTKSGSFLLHYLNTQINDVTELWSNNYNKLAQGYSIYHLVVTTDSNEYVLNFPPLRRKNFSYFWHTFNMLSLCNTLKSRGHQLHVTIFKVIIS